MQGNLHVPFLGGWAGAIPPGYPAREETCGRVTRLAPTQHHHTGTVLAYVFGRRQEICRSYYDSRKSLYLVAACGNHQSDLPPPFSQMPLKIQSLVYFVDYTVVM